MMSAIATHPGLAGETTVGFRPGPDFEGELRRFTSSFGTGTGLCISLDRSPDFFSALDVEGEDAAVAAFRRGIRIVGCAVMAQKRVHLDGRRDGRWIGQLGSARIDPDHRSGLLVARCFRQIHDWSQERRASLFLTTILDDNATARATFESGRAGLPRYRDWGRLISLAHPAGRGTSPWRWKCSREFEVRSALASELVEVTRFLREHAPKRQFYPCYTEEHFAAEHGLLRGLNPADILVARSKIDGRIVGTLGVWDQSSFRRWVVQRLPRPLTLVRPVWNLLSRAVGGPSLPAPGQALRQFLASVICVRDDDESVFATLLDAAHSTVTRRGGGWLTIGVHERDPLLAVARTGHPRELVSRLYVVHWPEGAAAADSLDRSRCPYVELGAL